MAKALRIRCCSAFTDSPLPRMRTSRSKSGRTGVQSVNLRSFSLGSWRETNFAAIGLPGLRGATSRRAHVVAAAWDELLHNQVLVSSTIAGLVGQLVKPITSAAFGKGFNLKLIIKPGGMPSTHSAVVTSAATAMGLERGFSDSLFGFSVIVAALFMYDAQGVRRSVGKQAEVINTLVFTQMSNSSPPLSSPPNPSPYAIGVELARDPVQAELKFMEEADSTVAIPKASKSTAVFDDVKRNGLAYPNIQNEQKSELNGIALGRTEEFYRAAEKLPSVKEGQVTLQELGDQSGWRHIPLKESVGHTKLEVLIGAAWGIAITLALHSNIMFDQP